MLELDYGIGEVGLIEKRTYLSEWGLGCHVTNQQRFC